jgi:hypothetical protein
MFMTHKALLAMVFFWILQWCRLDITFGARLSGAGVGLLLMGLLVVGNYRDRCVLFYLLELYLCYVT